MKTVLSDANQRWHLMLDAQYQAFLESLTALDMEQARQQWTSFKRSLAQHILYEETHIEPLAKAWENNTLELIRSDHLILRRLLPRLDSALVRIDDADCARAKLVRELDGFIKLRNVLEHHDLREMENLYPVLDQHLEAQQLAQLAAGMDHCRSGEQ